MQAEDDSPAREGGSTPGEAAVRAHYGRPGLFEEIMAALAAAGKDIRRLTISDLAPVDHFHGRGLEATAEMADLLPVAAGDRLLDIGSGLGGPARYMAARFGCRVEGIDLTPQFVDCAVRLTELLRLGDRVSIRVGNALDLPFAAATFDGACSQHVTMNIADRERFFAEAARVLKPGGCFALSEHGGGDAGPPHFPVPWSEDGSGSYLVPPERTVAIMEAAGFTAIEVEETGPKYLAGYRRALELAGQGKLPPLGVHLLLGPTAPQKMANAARNIAEGRTRPILVTATKRA